MLPGLQVKKYVYQVDSNKKQQMNKSTVEEITKHGYEMITCTWDLYGELLENLDEQTKEILDIKTHYEKLFTAKGSVIKYCNFKIH